VPSTQRQTRQRKRASHYAAEAEQFENAKAMALTDSPDGLPGKPVVYAFSPSGPDAFSELPQLLNALDQLSREARNPGAFLQPNEGAAQATRATAQVDIAYLLCDLGVCPPTVE